MEVLSERVSCFPAALWLSLWCLVAPWAAAQEGAEPQPPVRIIVHPDNAVAAMPKAELSDLLLGKVATWPDGSSVVIVDQASTSPVREALCRAVHSRSAASVTQFWTRAILSGRSQAPVQTSSDAEMLDYVRGHPGSIGYVSAEAPLDGVRQLPLVDRPKRVHFVEPEYTRMAKRAMLYGVVLMRLTIGEDGAVIDVDVVQHLEMGLSESAAKAARAWRYEPTRVDGQAVKVLLEEKVRFEYFG